MDYPYKNLDLKSLKGERWDDVPGFDGEYEVSNFGRIKSLRRWRAAGLDGKGYYTKERIRKQGERISYNKFIKEDTYSLGIKLKQNGVSYSTSTARYVYYVFVKPFDLYDKDLMITFKDSNGRNLLPKNLVLTNRSELMKRSSKLQRRIPPTPKAPVNQYTLDGKLVARYSSLAEASKKTGCHFTSIMACMLHHIHQHKNFRWEYADKVIEEKKQIVTPIFNDPLWKMIGRPKSSKKNPIPVLNLSPETMPGEKWKEMEGSSGVYFISNFGRVKSISRLSSGKISVWKPGTIKKLLSDGKKGKRPSCLLSSFSINGAKHQIAVGRLVYYYFVKKFNLSDKSIRIKYKDGCFHNLNASNLVLRK